MFFSILLKWLTNRLSLRHYVNLPFVDEDKKEMTRWVEGGYDYACRTNAKVILVCYVLG